MDPSVRAELCVLLNNKKSAVAVTNNDWYKLAIELSMEDIAKCFVDDNNPMDCIIDSYIVSDVANSKKGADLNSCKNIALPQIQ